MAGMPVLGNSVGAGELTEGKYTIYLLSPSKALHTFVRYPYSRNCTLFESFRALTHYVAMQHYATWYHIYVCEPHKCVNAIQV